jgi:hypothetical protein
MNNPFQDRDLTQRLLFPILSWSSYSAFRDYDKDLWYESFVLGNKGPSNQAMEAGRIIGEKLATDPDYLPQVPRPEIYEQELHTNLNGIGLIGHIDGWSPKALDLKEYKTTQNINRWTQEAVDSWGQITFYCLLVWLNYKIPPEKLTLSLTAILLKESGSFDLEPTGEVKVFKTKRTMKDLLVFGASLKAVHKEMTEFVDSYKHLR